MVDEDATKVLSLHQYWHAPAQEAAERWTAMRRAGWQLSEREPALDDELPLLRAAE